MSLELQVNAAKYVLAKKRPKDVQAEEPETDRDPPRVKPVPIKRRPADLPVNKPTPIRPSDVVKSEPPKQTKVEELTEEELRMKALADKEKRRERKARIRENRRERLQTEADLREQARAEWYRLNPDAQEGDLASDPYGRAYVELYIKCHMDPQLTQWWDDPNYGLGLARQQYKYRREQFYERVGYPEQYGIVPRVDLDIYVVYFPPNSTLAMRSWLKEFSEKFEGTCYFAHPQYNSDALNLDEADTNDGLEDYDLHIAPVYNLDPEASDMKDIWYLFQLKLHPELIQYSRMLIVVEEPEFYFPDYVEHQLWTYVKNHPGMSLGLIYPHDFHFHWHELYQHTKNFNFKPDELDTIMSTIMEINPYQTRLADDLRTIKYQPHKEKVQRIKSDTEETMSTLLNYNWQEQTQPFVRMGEATEQEQQLYQKLFDSYDQEQEIFDSETSWFMENNQESFN